MAWHGLSGRAGEKKRSIKAPTPPTAEKIVGCKRKIHIVAINFVGIPRHSEACGGPGRQPLDLGDRARLDLQSSQCPLFAWNAIDELAGGMQPLRRADKARRYPMSVLQSQKRTRAATTQDDPSEDGVARITAAICRPTSSSSLILLLLSGCRKSGLGGFDQPHNTRRRDTR